MNCHAGGARSGESDHERECRRARVSFDRRRIGDRDHRLGQTLDRFTAGADRVPPVGDCRVVPGTALELVRARSSDQSVRTRPSDKCVVATAADQLVVSSAADQRVRPSATVDPVPAARADESIGPWRTPDRGRRSLRQPKTHPHRARWREVSNPLAHSQARSPTPSPSAAHALVPHRRTVGTGPARLPRTQQRY